MPASRVRGSDPSDTFGEIPGVNFGDKFNLRSEIKNAGLHKYPEDGISYNDTGATCIVMSGRHYSDKDRGETFTYIGFGKGRDQEWVAGNEALQKSLENKYPVRVIRGSKGNPRWSPISGYRYDGLYEVVDSRRVRSGEMNKVTGLKYMQCEFDFKQLSGQPKLNEQRMLADMDRILHPHKRTRTSRA